MEVPTIRERSVLSGMRVNETMRRQVVHLPLDQTLAKAINHLIRFKASALLVTDGNGKPMGVVSKTDIMGAFYAGLPVETYIADIMTGPPMFCYPDDELESALDVMRQNSIHRLYVRGSDANTTLGTLAYPDIVGQIYRFCRVCSRGIRKKGCAGTDADTSRARVREAMTRSVVSFRENEMLSDVIEALSVRGFGAVLITETQNRPVGVISKTDLIIAYHHGLSPDSTTRSVMSAPVSSSSQEDWLVDALRQMLARDVQRLFVHDGNPDNIIGVLSLSDAARFRSGTCRACMPSRIMAG
jgi:CBS domain-containing protein